MPDTNWVDYTTSSSSTDNYSFDSGTSTSGTYIYAPYMVSAPYVPISTESLKKAFSVPKLKIDPEPKQNSGKWLFEVLQFYAGWSVVTETDKGANARVFLKDLEKSLGGGKIGFSTAQGEKSLGTKILEVLEYYAYETWDEVLLDQGVRARVLLEEMGV